MTTTPKNDIRRTRSLSKAYVDLIVELRNKPDTVFDVIIVGSGYGASIAAQQLAQLRTANGDPFKIAVLERGSEYLPGMFPSSFAEIPKHVRFATQSTGKVTGETEGLFDLRLGNDVNALVVNGLGGGSLINAGVMLEPDFKSFTSDLPQTLVDALRDSGKGGYLQKAKKLLLQEPLNLNATPNTIYEHPVYGSKPNGVLPLKFKRLEDLTKGGKKIDSEVSFEAAEISVAMQPVVANEFGIKLEACVACGDCMTGCNVGAKASLNTNLLAQAKRDGVDIYTGASVLSVKRIPEKELWELEVVHTSRALRNRASVKQNSDTPPDEAPLRARYVILAAGTFGSTEILLRSRSASLAFSNKLGERFSCNGDNIAAVHRLPANAHCTDLEYKELATRKVGPTITGTIKVPPENGNLGFLVQEFAVPGPLNRIFSEIVTTGRVISDLEKSDLSRHGKELNREMADKLDPMAVDSAAIDKSLLLGIIGHDDAAGVLKLPFQANNPGTFKNQEGGLQIVWPQARDSKHINESYKRLEKYCAAAFPKSGLLANPIWRLLPSSLEQLVTQPRGPVLTVHPLGGCTIGEPVENGTKAPLGVVDEYGVVYNKGNIDVDNWQGSLLVLDGSIIPGSIGVNPSLTISAIALRAIENFIASKKLNADLVIDTKSTKPPLSACTVFDEAQPKKSKPPLPTVINVTERLVGPVRLAKPDGSSDKFILELTLKYERIKLRHLIQTWGGRKQKLGTLPVGCKDYTEASYIRIFRAGDWYLNPKNGLSLRVADDPMRERYAIFRANIEGEMTFLHRKKSNHWCRRLSLWAYLKNRGFRDTYQALCDYIKSSAEASWWRLGEIARIFSLESCGKYIKFGGVVQALKATFSIATQKPPMVQEVPGPGIWARVSDAWRLSSRAGEVRLFNYKLDVKNIQPISNAYANNDSVLSDTEKNELKELMAYLAREFKGRIKGEKRFTYNRRSNPWKQLTRLTLTKLPLAAENAPVLSLDGRFIAKQGIPLLEIVQQENHANALLDMASFGLYMARLLMNIHMWSFRKPDSPPNAPPYVEIDRLPGSIKGLPEPEITEILVSYDSAQGHTLVRLTRYKGNVTELNPIAFIHGYSISGNTFTHPSLKVSAVEYLWKNQGTDPYSSIKRDVWVIDLRTSAALPTARRAWSYEEVALTDIPAALVHIKNVTGKKVDVVAHCVGAAMISMAILTSADEVRNGKTELGVGDKLSDAQLGTLEAFNGLAQKRVVGSPHPTINSIALSQKGPLIRYTESNIFRAYLMSSLKSLIPVDYQFRVSKKPKTAEQVIDRLLATLPYPDDEYDRENPACMTANTHWVSTRHRMDALYAQDFSACNMSDATLSALDELFGPINIETLEQTIHFVRFNGITNQRGRSVFVSIKKLRERWAGIPTFAFHGGDNGLADVNTQELLDVNFKAAGLPFVKKIFEGFGHQDVFIGENSHIVFKELQAFLDAPTTYVPTP